jgi:hypothetical protein
MSCHACSEQGKLRPITSEAYLQPSVRYREAETLLRVKRCTSGRPRGYVVFACTRSHSSNVLLAHVLLQPRIEVVPPLIQHALADKLEPWCELERRVFEHCLEVILGNVTGIAGFVGIDVKIDISLDEENIINYGLSASFLLPKTTER